MGSLENWEWAGLRRKLDSEGMTTLGTWRTGEVARASQASPMARVLGVAG